MKQMLWMHEIKISIELKILRNVSIQKYNYQVKIKYGRIENVDDKARKLAIIGGFHMTSPKFKLRNSQIFLSSYFIFKNSSKPIFIQIFTRKRLFVLWLSTHEFPSFYVTRHLQSGREGRQNSFLYKKKYYFHVYGHQLGNINITSKQ